MEEEYTSGLNSDVQLVLEKPNLKLKNASRDFVSDLQYGDIVLLISTDNAVDFLYNTDSNLEDLMSRQFEQLVEVLSFLNEEK